jgi:hypothetical protein
LAFTVALADLATLAVEDRSRHAMTTFTPIQLREDSMTIAFVIEVGQQVERLGDPTRPNSPIARVRVEGRLLRGSEPINSEALIVPRANDPAIRSRSSQFFAISSGRTRCRASAGFSDRLLLI